MHLIQSVLSVGIAIQPLLSTESFLKQMWFRYGKDRYAFATLRNWN
jgi:hypothetical protein